LHGVKFVGVDLAWSENNDTGVAVVEGGKVTASDVVSTDADIVEFVTGAVGDDGGLVAIDAPLVVPNETGRREAERLVGKLFRRYDAGAHPANRRHLSRWTGRVRGEDVARLLEREGFEHSPRPEGREGERKLFEVYPHPSMVVMFGLPAILRYKSRAKRSYEFRWREFERYVSLLGELVGLPREIADQDVTELRGGALKSFEDRLDAVFCACIARRAWKRPGECEVLGSMDEGYILTPVFPHMRDALSQQTLDGFQ
jgi:predicted RNase H-like nuclease